MALPGHSPPPPFPIAGSPPRLLSGHPEHHFPPSMYNHRPLIPPSPQSFPRFQSTSQTQMSHPSSIYDVKAPSSQQPPVSNPHKRPGSSMSLSSILGAEPERQSREMPLFHNTTQNSSDLGFGAVSAPGMSVNAIMSPPQQPPRGGLGDFAYKRSHTPDRLEMFTGNRQRSASSSAPMPPFRSIYEPQDRYAKPPTPQFHSLGPLPGPPPPLREEQDERLRRTSLSGILQRPNSQPQASALPPQFSRPYETLPPSRPNWYADPPTQVHEQSRTNGPLGSYDTKPPFRETPRSVATSHPSPAMPLTQPPSPELRRPINGSFNRGLAGLLNGPTQSSEPSATSAQNMIRQASSQSHSDRSVFDERSRFRHFSPYASNLDEQGRKSSEDITHKTITGLSFENRRRYSPVPRAVQGAQAQTPVPDDGPRGDQGKVFSGIGGGLGNSTTPVPTTSSPFKKDDKLSRSTETPRMGKAMTSNGKRSRKAQDEDLRAEVDQENKKNGSGGKSNKKAKHQSYKIGAEETNGSIQRRGTPVANGSANRSNGTSNTGPASSTRYDTQPIFKPRKTVKVASIISQVLKKPRKHLGTFRYEPVVLLPEALTGNDADSDICIEPKLLPSFSEAEDLNATFTIHVSKTWLHDRERKIVCSTRNLWGSGIYTDDSDPLAAAIHMGWVKPSLTNIDEALLQKIVHDQNPKVEISKELKPPSKPLDLIKGRDLKITCVVMPLLERYEDSARFGLKSRPWPEVPEGAPHDGVSFSILKVELADIGLEERRMGRTGVHKRARMHAQLLQRERATRLEKERVERMMKRIKERADAQKQQQQHAEKKKSPSSTTKAPSPLSKEVTMDDDIIQPPPTLKDGEEWIRQLATAAA